jgi:hypothetical protein
MKDLPTDWMLVSRPGVSLDPFALIRAWEIVVAKIGIRNRKHAVRDGYQIYVLQI